MTISSDALRKAGPYPGNGVAVSFPFNFKVFADTDIVVTLVTLATLAEATLALVADYTVTLNADQNASPGGSVSYEPLGAPMDALHEIYITSAVRELQPLDLTNGGGFFPKVISDALDRAVILIQQLTEEVSRCLKVSLGSGLTPADISSLAALTFNVVLADGSVGTAKLAPGDVTSEKIADHTIKVTDLNQEVLDLIQAGGGGGGASGSTGAGSGGGRITFSSGVPVMAADVAGAVTVYYTPFASAFVQLNDGTDTFAAVAFAELSQTLADATKSPAASVANSNYDLFVWDDAGTLRLSRGPAWASGIARGVGAGTSEIMLVGSTYVNKNAITNGPLAKMGTYVGSISTNAANQLDWKLGSIAAGGGEAWLGLWNMSNRVRTGVSAKDNTYIWTNGLNGVYRGLNNSAGSRVTFIVGLSDDLMEAQATASWSNNATPTVDVAGRIGIGLDTSTASESTVLQGRGGATGIADKVISEHLNAFYRGFPGLGRHYLQAVEINETNAAGATSSFGGGSYGTVGLVGVFSV